MLWIEQIPIDEATGLLKGLFDEAIERAGRVWHAVQVIAYFNYITRVADALGVEPEDFIQPWGAPFEDRL